MLENDGLLKTTMDFILKYKEIVEHNITRFISDKKRIH